MMIKTKRTYKKQDHPDQPCQTVFCKTQEDAAVALLALGGTAVSINLHAAIDAVSARMDKYRKLEAADFKTRTPAVMLIIPPAKKT